MAPPHAGTNTTPHRGESVSMSTTMSNTRHKAKAKTTRHRKIQTTTTTTTTTTAKTTGVFVPYVAPTHLRLTPKPLLSSVPCNLAIRASAGLKSLHASIASQNDSACAHSLSSHQDDSSADVKSSSRGVSSVGQITRHRQTHAHEP